MKLALLAALIICLELVVDGRWVWISNEPLRDYTTDECKCGNAMPYQYGKYRGCMIITPAPRGKACKCDIGFRKDAEYVDGEYVYHYITLCTARVVECRDPNAKKCKNPDDSLASCEQGQGQCEGYKYYNLGSNGETLGVKEEYLNMA